MDQFVLQKQFMPSLRKIHRCLRSRDMGGICHSDMILLSMYYRGTDESAMRVKELGRCSNISPTSLPLPAAAGERGADPPHGGSQRPPVPPRGADFQRHGPRRPAGCVQQLLF